MALALLTACSSAEKSTAAESSTDQPVSAEIQQGYQGRFDPPPSRGPAAVRGKVVWTISCGEAFATCSLISKEFQKAGAQLGWRVAIQDSKGDPTAAVSLIKQAVAARVDGISIMSRDCPLIKSGLLAAKAAKIPVVNLAGADCDSPRFGPGGESLFAATVKMMGFATPDEYYRAWNVARADYTIARIGGSGKILAVRESTNAGLIAQHQAFRARVESKCPRCRLVEVDYTFNQLPEPATQMWKSALLANPDAKVMEMSIDSLMGLGLQVAIRQARIPRLLVIGGEGGNLNYDLIRDGVQTASVPIPYAWFSWGMADTLNRIFAGEQPNELPNQGGGWQFVDKNHNLPAQGQPYEPSIDFRAAYKKIWAGQ